MRNVIISILFLFMLVCCGKKNNYEYATQEEKYFYTDCGGLDYIRFPLIMPYDVMCIDFEKKNWVVDLQVGWTFDHEINEVDKLAVKDSVILIHSTSLHRLEDEEKPKQWFIIIPSQKIELYFTNEIEFTLYLKQLKINEVIWMNVEDVNNEFQSNSCLPWIPACN